MGGRAAFERESEKGGIAVAEAPDTWTGGGTPPFPLSARPPGAHAHSRPRAPRPAGRRGRQSDGPWSALPVVFGIALIVALGFVALKWSAYNDTSIDTRVTVSAPAAHRGNIAKFINRSSFWEPYFAQESPSGTTKLVRFELVTERRRLSLRGGDYDPGNVNVVFRATNLENDETLFEREMTVALSDVLIGRFDDDSSRDQIQEIAFRDAEDKFLPYLDRWVDLAAIEAIGQKGSSGKVYIPLLQEVVDDTWSTEDMAVAADNALNAIQG